MASDHGSWPSRRTAALDWLVKESVEERYAEKVFARLCALLVEEGLPLARTSLHLRTLHPQFMGARMLWRPGMEGAEIFTATHDELKSPMFLNSPIRALFEGADGFRQRLELEIPGEEAFPIYDELREEGITDYVAMPMPSVDRKRYASSWATARPGGFTTADLTTISEILPVLAMAVEIRLKNRIARNLVDTYVGRHAGALILAGAITRGAGATVRAAIWTCDLRGFTEISELWPRDDVITLLNEYFDVMGEPVHRNGGEILKFIGDALLAIFPLENEDACGGAIRAAIEARRGMRALNRSRAERGQHPLGFGSALHVGDVMYGNIGSRDRLDFTVIGPAVNVASRLEGLSKKLGREVLISGAFTRLCPCGGLGLEPLGQFPLRGVGQELEVFALPEAT